MGADRRWLTTGQVARKLGWNPTTIRAHLVPAAGWTPESGKIPSTRIGARWLIPRWWVDARMAELDGPPAIDPSQPIETH